MNQGFLKFGFKLLYVSGTDIRAYEPKRENRPIHGLITWIIKMHILKNMHICVKGQRKDIL